MSNCTLNAQDREIEFYKVNYNLQTASCKQHTGNGGLDSDPLIKKTYKRQSYPQTPRQLELGGHPDSLGFVEQREFLKRWSLHMSSLKNVLQMYAAELHTEDVMNVAASHRSRRI